MKTKPVHFSGPLVFVSSRRRIVLCWRGPVCTGWGKGPATKERAEVTCKKCLKCLSKSEAIVDQKKMIKKLEKLSGWF